MGWFRNNKKFRVLLIDDSEEVLKSVFASVNKPVVTTDSEIEIEVECLKIEFEDITVNGITTKRISLKTINSLGFSEHPFDYIFSDFAYIADSAANSALRTQLERTQSRVTKAQLNGIVLQCIDIVKRFYVAQSNGEIAPIQINRIQEHFINHKGKVIIYTHSPYPFDSYFDQNELKIRIVETREAFLKAKEPEFILMHEDFPISPALLSAFNNDPNGKKNHFTNLLSRNIEQIMQYAALEHVIKKQNNLRYNNVKAGAAKLLIWGLILGVLTALFGEILFHLLWRAIRLMLPHWKFETWYGNLGIFFTVGVIFYGLLLLLAMRLAKMTEDISSKLSGKKIEE